MSATQRKKSVFDLDLGMFVSELDRPWHETPFPIQGFLIRNSDDIDSLTYYCTHVYIDDVDEREEIAGAAPDESDQVDLKKETIKLPPIVVKEPTEHLIASSHGKEVRACQKILKRVYEGLRSLYEADSITPEMTEGLRTISWKMSESVSRNPNSMLWLTRIQSHSSHTYQHSLRMTLWALTLGRHLGLSSAQLSDLSAGCLLAQVGKITLPESLLAQEGKLTPLDFEVFQGYVNAGARMLEGDNLPAPVMGVVQYHQERHNGSGFPNAVPGTSIPLLASIAGLAYYFELLITPAPASGRTPRSPSEALNILYKVKDAKFHSDLVDSFIQAVGVYPVGSHVELSDGHQGVVLSHNPESRLLPQVILIIGPDGKPLPKNRTIDLKGQSRSEADPLTIKRCLKDRRLRFNTV